MPHITRFQLDGEIIPSVNTITGALSQEGLLRWYRKLGFKKADKVGGAARDQGIKLAEVFERYRKTGKTGHISAYQRKCVDNWTKWYETTPLTLIDRFIEPHLVNTVDKYHGSPDVILEWKPDSMLLGDDKSKKRFAGYNLLMNEHAYAMCDSIEVDGVITKLPWEPPIRAFYFWTYHPETGELFTEQHEFDPQVYQDFLLCKQMLKLNKKAEKYFNERAVLLPEPVTK